MKKQMLAVALRGVHSDGLSRRDTLKLLGITSVSLLAACSPVATNVLVTPTGSPTTTLTPSITLSPPPTNTLTPPPTSTPTPTCPTQEELIDVNSYEELEEKRYIDWSFLTDSEKMLERLEGLDSRGLLPHPVETAIPIEPGWVTLDNRYMELTYQLSGVRLIFIFDTHKLINYKMRPVENRPWTIVDVAATKIANMVDAVAFTIRYDFSGQPAYAFHFFERKLSDVIGIREFLQHLTGLGRARTLPVPLVRDPDRMQAFYKESFTPERGWIPFTDEEIEAEVSWYRANPAPVELYEELATKGEFSNLRPDGTIKVPVVYGSVQHIDNSYQK